MSGLELKIKLDDFKVRALLDNLAEFGEQHGRDMFDEIGSYLVSETANRFREGVQPDGAPLLPSLRAIETGGKTLVDRGHLRDSYTYQVFPGGLGVEAGSSMVYAAIHHFGGETGRNKATKLPARPVLGINDDDEREIDAIVFDHLRGVLKQ